jgi:ATP-dependent DNA helicase RecG
VLAYFGDMDVSALREKPPGRQPIDTRVLPIERLEEVVARLSGALASGARAYWICPLVDESETLDVAAAEERASALRAIFGGAVGLIHGKMPGPERDEAMERFQRGETKIIVATTVVEVGVDVPEATIMIVEHAERFGLAQLHQLRGRVGRGAGRSACLLIYKGPLGEAARTRLETLRETDDGFRIAEEDLKLRGEGDVLGARQAGAPGFRFARLEVHGALLARAREEAQAALARSERLAGDENRGLRLLLYLFERDEAARLIEAG